MTAITTAPAAESPEKAADIRLFHYLGWLEGISSVLLFTVAMPLKYLAGRPEAVKVVGMAHGILFMMYVAWALKVVVARRWPAARFGLCFIASIIPGMTFWVDRKLPGWARGV